MEHKTLSFEIKAVDYEGRTLEGFGAAFGNLDQVGDVIHPGAFRKTLVERGGRIKFLWQHDPGEPIGRLLEAHEEPGGLFVKAVISDTQRGRDALALLKDKAIGEMSIGYDTVKGGMDYSKDQKGNTVRNLREIKLYEISLVTFPANEQAIVTAVKEQDVMPTESKPYRNVPDDLQDQMESCVQQVMEKGHDKESAIAICYTSVVEGKSLDEASILHSEGGDPISQRKYGRTISAATLAKLKAARDVIDELCEMGVMPEVDTELTDDIKGAKITQTPEETQAVTEIQPHTKTAGPVRPPTELLREIELSLLDIATLEVQP